MASLRNGCIASWSINKVCVSLYTTTHTHKFCSFHSTPIPFARPPPFVEYRKATTFAPSRELKIIGKPYCSMRVICHDLTQVLLLLLLLCYTLLYCYSSCCYIENRSFVLTKIFFSSSFSSVSLKLSSKLLYFTSITMKDHFLYKIILFTHLISVLKRLRPSVAWIKKYFFTTL